MLSTIIRTIIIYFLLTLCVRLMGKRQIGELQPGELVITILISEIAASPITNTEQPVFNTVITLLLLVFLEFLSSVLNRKSVRLRYITDGRPVTVITKGNLHQKNLKRLRYTVDDLLSALRQKDVFDIDDVQYAVVETNGTLSVLLKNEFQPLTPESVNNPKKKADAPCPVIIDGKIINSSLDNCPLTATQIQKEIKNKNLKIKNIILMTIDKEKNLKIIEKE